MRTRIGIDTGGTFTDFAAVDEASRTIHFGKRLSTPRDPSEAIQSGLAALLASHGGDADGVTALMHATTVVGNAIIERRASRVALLITQGFTDTLVLGREFRYDIYDTHLKFPEPLVSRTDTFPVRERMRADGVAIEPLTDEGVAEIIGKLSAGRYEAVAICLLNSYRNPEHEERLATALRAAFPELFVSVSSEIVRRAGEYERANASCMNALVQPVTALYLRNLTRWLVRGGVRAPLYCMSSSGGLLSGDAAVDVPLRLLESGPAAGALGAAAYARRLGHDNVLALDVGGTTAKACVIQNGRPAITDEFEVARLDRLTAGSGLPVRLPAVDMLEIGAGGGSIARVDEFRLITVGPESAGAAPGPACYARGGDRATVTDANLVLGYLNPDFFLGGDMKLDSQRAKQAIQELADSAEMTSERAAWAVHEVASQTMANALRTHAIERGVDFRQFALIAFGGAGPIHAHRIATALQMQTVIFPWGAGVFSAAGLLVAPVRFDTSRSLTLSVEDVGDEIVESMFDEMEAELRLGIERSLPGAADVAITRGLGVRYAGQGVEVRIDLPGSRLKGAGEAIAVAFDAAYRSRYGWVLPGARREIVTWYASAAGGVPDPWEVGEFGAAVNESGKAERQVFASASAGFKTCAVYDRYALGPGATITGPALIEERESTIYIGPGATATVDGPTRAVVMSCPALVAQ